MKRYLVVAVGVMGLGLAACGSSSSNKASGDVSLRAGTHDPADATIAVEMYLPQSITITQGATVTWTIAGPEPHSVTFEPAGQTLPSAETPAGQALFTKVAQAPAAGFDGKEFVSSGLVPQGPQAAPPFKVKFSTVGKFTYQCLIHSQMTGTVNVVAKGTKADNQAAIQSRGDSEASQWITEGQAAKKTLASTPPVSTKNADGTTTWTIEMGAATAHTDILAYSPVPANIKAKDRVMFVNNSAAPHTASFAGKQTLPQDPTSAAATTPKPGPSPQTLNATDFFNTGTLPPNEPPNAGPPLAARSFVFVASTAGTYNYVCIYHVGSGMAGTLSVT